MKTQNHTHGRVGIIGIVLIVIAILVVAAVLFPVFVRTGDHGGGRKSWCQSNLKQLTLAFSMYQNDYNGMYPSSACRPRNAPKRWSEADDLIFRKAHGALPPWPRVAIGAWPEFVHPYLKNVNVVYCPSDPDYKPLAQTKPRDQVSYVVKKAFHQAWWGKGMPKGATARKEADFEYPADQLLLYERVGWHFGDTRKGDMSVKPVPGVSLNMAFVDGHVVVKGLPDPLNGEPDFYNTDAKTGKPAEAKADPRVYLDTLD